MSPQSSPEEQRNILIATVLIAVITFVWMWQVTPPPPPEDQAPTAQEQAVVDSPAAQQKAEAQQQIEADEEEAGEASDEELAVIEDSTIAGAQQGTARTITVETELYRVRFSTKGAAPVSFELKEYTQFDQETPVELISQQEHGALSLAFTTPRNHNVDTRSFYFEPELVGGGALSDSTLQVSGDSTALAFTAPVGRGHIRFVYTFYPEEYEVGLRVEQENAQTFATSDGYEVVWHGGLPFSEDHPETEAQNAGAFARSGGDVVSLTLDSDDRGERRLAGEVSWTAVKNKYFTAVVIPDQSLRTQGAELVGEKAAEEPVLWEDYTTRLLMPTSAGGADAYRLYLGPMDYYQISSYGLGLYDMVDYGWDFFEWMTRPLAKYFFIPIFQLLSSFIASYGIVIILLAIIVKTLVYPLTKSSYKSMAKMRELQPKMEAIKEKYGDNPQKQQEAMMKMYKETGVNPLGGCLPMLLQYPIIIALWQFLPTSIEIRQQSFLWAHDLSVPDVILNLPFAIPLYGDYVAGFTLLMGFSMVVTMQMQTSATASGAQAKVLTYVFPVMIFFIFNQFAAGLSLYYLAYNIVTAVQQKYINKQIESESAEAESNGRGKAADARKARRKKART